MADEKDPKKPRTEAERERPAQASEREKADQPRRGRLEAMVPEVVKRAMLSGLGALFVTEETIRTAVSDMPKEAVNFFIQQADNTKDQLLSHVAKEVREFLEEADLAAELGKVLTSLSLEITTNIRFVPVDEEGGLRPDVQSDVTVKKHTRKKQKPPPKSD